MAREFAMPPEIQYAAAPSFQKPQTAMSDAEFARLEAKYGAAPASDVGMSDAEFNRLEAKYGEQPAPASDLKTRLQSGFDERKQQQVGIDQGAGTAAVQGFNSAIPFGERMTAGLGAGGAFLIDKVDGGSSLPLSDYYTTARENQAATEAASPNAYLGGAITGLAGTLPAAFTGALAGQAATTGIRGTINAAPQVFAKAGDFIRRGSNVGSRAVRGATVAAPTAGLYGYGASKSDLDSAEAGQDALSNFGMGGMLGAAAPIAGAVLAPQIRKLADYLTKKVAIKSGEIVIDKMPKDMQKVYSRLREDFSSDDEFKQALNSYASKQGKTLLETGGKRTASLAEGSAMYPSGGAKAEEFFDEAIGLTPDRLKTMSNKTISPSTAYYDDLDSMVKAGREEAAPLYNQAYKANQSVQSPIVDRILQTPEGKSALGEAAKNMQNEMSLVARPTPEMTAMARELGVVSEGGVSSGLKLETLDYIKKSMDDTINAAMRKPDGAAEARRIIALKKALVSELDKADKSGLYAKARATSGDYLSNKKAMDDGLDFFKADSEITGRAIAKYGTNEKKAYRNGIMKAVRDKIDNTKDGSNVAGLFKKPSTRTKLAQALSPEQYTKLMDEAKDVDNLFKLRNQMTGNSRTAMRQISAQEFDSAGEEILTGLASGKGFTLTTIDGAAKWVARRFDRMSDKSAKEVADILYEQDPKKKYQIVKALTNKLNSEGQSLAKSEAASKLQVLYGLSDAISLRKQPKTAPMITAYPRGTTKQDLQKAFEAKKGNK